MEVDQNLFVVGETNLVLSTNLFDVNSDENTSEEDFCPTFLGYNLFVAASWY